MKFTGTKENLSRGINIAAYLATRATNLPILTNVLLEAKDGVLEVSSTNLEIGIKTKVRGKVGEAGSFAVRAKVLLDYVNLLPSGNVDMGVSKDRLSVACENFKTALRGQQADEFPIIPQVDSSLAPLKMPVSALKRALEVVMFAASIDETRPEIGGVFVVTSNGQLVLVATDSYRLAEKNLEAPANVQERRVILPLKALQEVSRIAGLSDDVEEAELYLDENQAMFVMGTTTITSRIIDGNYPDYKQIIPSKTKTSVVLGRENFVQAVKSAAPFTKAGVNDVHLAYEPKDKTMKLSARNSQVGEQEVVLPSEGAGEKVEVTFNYRYLLDGLLNMEGEKVELHLETGSTPALLKSPKDKSYLYLIMPIKQ